MIMIHSSPGDLNSSNNSNGNSDRLDQTEEEQLEQIKLELHLQAQPQQHQQRQQPLPLLPPCPSLPQMSLAQTHKVPLSLQTPAQIQTQVQAMLPHRQPPPASLHTSSSFSSFSSFSNSAPPTPSDCNILINGANNNTHNTNNVINANANINVNTSTTVNVAPTPIAAPSRVIVTGLVPNPILNPNPGFINLLENRDSMQYLFQINSIFSLRNDPRIKDSQRATEDFQDFFDEIVLSIHTLADLEAFTRKIDQDHLVRFYSSNFIADTDYEIKTKVRALFVSLYIQKSIILKEKENPDYFRLMKTELMTLLDNQPIIESQGFKLYMNDAADVASFTRFYTVLKEAQRWQTHAKWEKFAFYVASMAVGEGVWYCPGGAAKPETLRRKHLFAIVEKVTNKYHKCTKKRKTDVEGNASAPWRYNDGSSDLSPRDIAESPNLNSDLGNSSSDSAFAPGDPFDKLSLLASVAQNLQTPDTQQTTAVVTKKRKAFPVSKMSSSGLVVFPPHYGNDLTGLLDTNKAPV